MFDDGTAEERIEWTCEIYSEVSSKNPIFTLVDKEEKNHGGSEISGRWLLIELGFYARTTEARELYFFKKKKKLTDKKSCKFSCSEPHSGFYKTYITFII